MHGFLRRESKLKMSSFNLCRYKIVAPKTLRNYFHPSQGVVVSKKNHQFSTSKRISEGLGAIKISQLVKTWGIGRPRLLMTP